MDFVFINKTQFISLGGDNKIMYWDIDNKKCIGVYQINEFP